MKSNKNPSLVIITNLYPLPWEPNRATFNKQQFELLKDDYDLSILIPVAFVDYFKHRKHIKQSTNIRYVPYFYLPKIGRRFYSVTLFLSILIHSGLWLKKRKPSTIMASWAFPEAVAASWLSRLYKAKFFFKVHGSDINLHGKIPARAKQILSAAKKSQGILSVSKALANELFAMGVNKDAVHVIYNGVCHDKFGLSYPAKKGGDYILYIGNLKRDKGVMELIEGFNQIKAQHPNLSLVFAGSGLMLDTLANYVNTHSLSERVTFLGNVPHHELPAWLANAKALCLPSYNEGVPNVVLESMAAGTPILATSVGGIPEVVDENICGKLIPPKDVNAVANGLNELLTSQFSRDKIKQHAAQFTWQKNKTQLINMLKGDVH
ncbi:glycosyltransferase [Colwellia sp. 20A7]|uniref:glycosyltransferase n=1 Tax=Colwellia sp. 20A7 TaxID=2689569 RepID=UPI0013575DC1|nr:glycosyltransferase [Colwellia sp. 20A7]